jgi:gas vesicle protein
MAVSALSMCGAGYFLDKSAGAVVGAIIGAIVGAIVVALLNGNREAPKHFRSQPTRGAHRVREMPEIISRQIRQFQQLRDDGAITELEYQNELQRILDELSALP